MPFLERLHEKLVFVQFLSEGNYHNKDQQAETGTEWTPDVAADQCLTFIIFSRLSPLL